MSAIYTPASGENLDLSPSEFTAGSKLVLQCGADGNRNKLHYTWHLKNNIPTESCDTDKCAIDLSSTTSTLTLDPLLSYYAGNYTCNVSETDTPAAHNSDEFSVIVVGEWGLCYFSDINL